MAIPPVKSHPSLPSPLPKELTTEILLLPDGRVFVHNLTPTMAALLTQLDPNDILMRERAGLKKPAQPFLSG